VLAILGGRTIPLKLKILYFELGASEELPHELVALWRSRLADVLADVEFEQSTDLARAHRAAWMGEPFLLIGTAESLTRYFDGIDTQTNKIFADHAYYWVLTASSSYTHWRLRNDRVVVLNWNVAEQNVVRERLDLLKAFPRLRGMSKRTHFTRQEIQRLATGSTGPGRSVLILGRSGTGKEEVAHSLFESSDRARTEHSDKGGIYPISGAWLNMEPGMALTELIGLEPARVDSEVKYEGLVSLFSNGALFVDDFESAPRSVQECLLRIMSTPQGKAASYRKVGGTEDLETNVWLMFATNSEVAKMLQDDRLREDFMYRFEDRVLVLRSLKERPADFPTIARVIWDQLWEASKKEKPPLTSDVLKRLFAQDLEWEGNIRTLRALLALVVSMKLSPVHNSDSPGALIDQILKKGRTYKEWVGIVETDFFAAGQSLEEQIREADAGHARCMGPSENGDPNESDLTPSESKAKDALTAPGWEAFRRLLNLRQQPTKSTAVVRVSVRLSRIIWYLSVNDSITWNIAGLLSEVAEATAKKDLETLAGSNGPALIAKVTRSDRDRSKAEAYERVEAFFRQ